MANVKVLDIWYQKPDYWSMYINTTKRKPDKNGNTGKLYYYPTLSTIKRAQALQLKMIKENES